MTGKQLSSLILNLDIVETRGSNNPEILGVTYDSRRVQPGDLFTALEGFHTDGHLFIEQAIDAGASAVLHSGKLSSYRKNIDYIRIDDSRRALSSVSAAFHDHPSEELTVIGVTGTDGKSSTVWFIYQLLEALGASSGFISTVNLKTGEEVEKNPLRQSTPEAPEVQCMLRLMVDSGKKYAVIEATSHGLSERTCRLKDVQFNAAVLTNISHEHLEFHGTLKQYRSDKANLFRKLSGTGPSKSQTGASDFGVVNLDDTNYRFFLNQTDAQTYTYSMKTKEADLFAGNFEPDIQGTGFTIHLHDEKERAHLNLPGLFNVENLLAASLTVLKLLDIGLNDICPLFPSLKGVKGRMECIDLGQPFRLMVDYAHTPESFEKLFPLVKKYTPGSLLAVFGSAGERDRKKRPLQGRLAAEFCDFLVLTDEDPREEKSMAILKEIAAGCAGMKEGRDLFLEPDRKKAIRLAISEARKGDTLLLLGKGHEQSIIHAQGPVPWDEAEAARSILKEMGFGS